MAQFNLTRQIHKVFEKNRKQLLFAKSYALNQCAKEVKKELSDELKKVFNNPTPATLKSIIFFKRATKTDLTARIKIKDFIGKGNNPTQWLEAQIDGGSRAHKRSENQLKNKGILPPGMYMIPAAGVPKNQHGNVPASTYVKIISYLKGFSEMGYDANITERSRKRKKSSGMWELFVIKRFGQSHLKPGIYQRTSTGVKPLFIFVGKVTYRRRFDFYGVAEKTFKANWPKKLREAIDYAHRTAN